MDKYGDKRKTRTHAECARTQQILRLYPTYLHLLAPTALVVPSTAEKVEKASVVPDREGAELHGFDTEGWLLSRVLACPPPKPEAAAAVLLREHPRSSVIWDSCCLTASRMGKRSRDTSRKGS